MSDTDNTGPADPELARYQAALLDILHDGTDGRAMAAAIEALGGPHARDEGAFDPVLVQVAADLTRTWARLDTSSNPAVSEGGPRPGS